MKRFSLMSLAVLIGFTVGAARAMAEPAYPDKPITIVVGFAPGGGVDQMSRILAPSLGELLKVPVIIDIRAGASGAIGAGYVAHSKPDGYTLLMGHASSSAMLPAVMKKLPYDAVADFTPIALIGSVPQLVVVPASSPAKTFQEFISMVRNKDGSVTYASPGVGTPPHFAGELFQLVTKTKMTHIPYKGGGATLTDLIAGRVDAGFDTVPTLLPQVKGGYLRALATIDSKRSSALPDVPSTTELGYPDFQVGAWYMLMGPANMPRQIRDRLNAAVNTALQTANVKEQLKAMSTEIGGGSAEQAQVFLAKEIAKWAKVAAERKIVAD